MTTGGAEPFRVEAVLDECRDVRSFELRPADGGAPWPAVPGQSVRVVVAPPRGPRLQRPYTLSRAGGDTYRISVKRLPGGGLSNRLHDELTVGDLIELHPPAGDFHLGASPPDRPLLMIAGGIGVTPIHAMLQGLAAGGDGRDVVLVLAMRSPEEHPFRGELAELRAALPGLRVVTHYSGVAGRIAGDALAREVPDAAVRDVYLCGPDAMMGDLKQALARLGVPADRVFTESFGKAIETAPAASPVAAPGGSPAAGAASVTFAASGVTAEWDGGCASLLEFAEANGVEVSAGCLFGDCGTCMTALLQGEVDYNHPITATPDDGTCLPCSCRPRGAVVLDA